MARRIPADRFEALLRAAPEVFDADEARANAIEFLVRGLLA